jgi:GNAT superfamily N-acetyltransferase
MFQAPNLEENDKSLPRPQLALHECSALTGYIDAMGLTVLIHLDDDVRDELEVQARSRGIGLATFLHDLATEAAREARRIRIRQAGAAIGTHVATSAEGQAFYEEWGTPHADAS